MENNNKKLLEIYQKLDSHVPRDLESDFNLLSKNSANIQKEIFTANRIVNIFHYILMKENKLTNEKKLEYILSTNSEPFRLNSLIKGNESPKFAHLLAFINGNMNLFIESIIKIKDKNLLKDLIWKGIPQLFAFFSYDCVLEESSIFYRKLSISMNPEKFIDFVSPYFICCGVGPFCDLVFRTFFAQIYDPKIDYEPLIINLLNICNKNLSALPIHHLTLLVHLKVQWKIEMIWQLLIKNLILPNLIRFWLTYFHNTLPKSIKFNKFIDKLESFWKKTKFLPEKLLISFSHITVPDVLIIGKYSIPVYHILTIEGLLSLLNLNLPFKNFLISWKENLINCNTVLKTAPLKTEIFHNPLLQPDEPDLFFPDLNLTLNKYDESIPRFWKHYSSLMNEGRVKRPKFDNVISKEKEVKISEFNISSNNNETLNEEDLNEEEELKEEDNYEEINFNQEFNSKKMDLLSNKNPELDPEIIHPHTVSLKTHGLEKSKLFKTGNSAFDFMLENSDQNKILEYGLYSSIIDLQANGTTFEQYLYQSQKLITSENWISKIEFYRKTFSWIISQENLIFNLKYKPKTILTNFDLILINYPLDPKTRLWFSLNLMKNVEILICRIHRFKFWLMKRRWNDLIKVSFKQKHKFQKLPKQIFEKVISIGKTIQLVKPEDPFLIKFNVIFESLLFIEAIYGYLDKKELKEIKEKYLKKLYVSMILFNSYEWILQLIYVLEKFFRNHVDLYLLLG